MAANNSGTASAASRAARVESAAAAINLRARSALIGGSMASAGCSSKKPVCRRAAAKSASAVRRRRKIGVGFAAEYGELPKRLVGARARHFAVAAMDDEFRQHRIERGRDRLSLGHAGINAYVATIPRQRHLDDPAGRGHETARRAFGIDAIFDGVAVDPQRRLREAKRLAGGDAQLLGDEIDTGDHLGHRMLDLQPRVHFQKVKLAVAIDEFDRPGIAVAGSAGNTGGDVADVLALRIVERRRRRFLDDFLKAALDRAFAVEQMHDVAVGVAEHLHFDVARPLDVALDIKPAVAEITGALAARAHDLVVERRRLADDAHALAAAAGGRLDQERKSNRPGASGEGRRVVIFDCRWRDRKAAGGDEGAGAHLVAHEFDRLRSRTDKRKSRLRDLAGELGVLGQKAVARVDSAGAGLARRSDDLGAVEIGGDRRRAGDLDRVVGRQYCWSRRVGGVVDHDRLEPERLNGAQNPQRDLAAIGNEHTRERPTAARQRRDLRAHDWFANLDIARSERGR